MFISLQIIYPSLYSTPIPSNFQMLSLWHNRPFGRGYIVPCPLLYYSTLNLSFMIIEQITFMSSIVPFALSHPKPPDCLRPEFDEPIIGIFHDSPQFRHRKYWSLPRIAFLLTRFDPAFFACQSIIDFARFILSCYLLCNLRHYFVKRIFIGSLRLILS